MTELKKITRGASSCFTPNVCEHMDFGLTLETCLLLFLSQNQILAELAE